VTNVQGNVSSYSRTTALILCIFLGAFGAHRFYVGKSGTGVAILFLTLCTGLGSIWALVDLIMIITGSFTDNFERPLTLWDVNPTPTTQTAYSQSPPPQQTDTQPIPPPPKKEADEMFCNSCGSLCKKHETFCRNCGAALQH
jgi:TM2 domain-containing membrane protein YozV